MDSESVRVKVTSYTSGLGACHTGVPERMPSVDIVKPGGNPEADQVNGGVRLVLVAENCTGP